MEEENQQQQTEDYKVVSNWVITNQLLGEGSFGQVYRAFSMEDTSKLVAVKQIKIESKTFDEKSIQNLSREIKILEKVKSDYILQLFDVSRTKNNIYMTLEYCEQGDLQKLLEKRKEKRLTEREAVHYFRQICEGFKVLYNLKIIHRDIKPANILIKDGKAKIADFGFARCLESQGMEEELTLTYLGTPLYMSPQILRRLHFSSKCDIWSLGILFYEILYGRTPWTATNAYKLYKNIEKTPLNFPQNIKTSTLVQDMLTKMLQKEEKDRISWPELLEHPLIKLVQKKKNEINNAFSDELQRLSDINEYYCDQNKVMDIDKQQQLKAFINLDKNTSLDQIQEENNLSYNSNFISTGQNIQKFDSNQIIDEDKKMDMSIIQKQQDEYQKQINQISRIDSYLTFQRNICLFMNVIANSIYNLHKTNQIQINFILFHKIIVVLQKKQLISLQHLICVMSGTVLGEEKIYTSEDLKIYQKSRSFQETQQVIQYDNDYSKPFFKKILQKADQIFQEQLQQQQTGVQGNIQEFFQILNEDFRQNDTFENIFIKTLNEFINFIKKVLPQMKNNKLFLQTAIYVCICKKPAYTFKWEDSDSNYDFYQFYDNYNQMEEAELLEQLQHKLKFE